MAFILHIAAMSNQEVRLTTLIFHLNSHRIERLIPNVKRIGRSDTDDIAPSNGAAEISELGSQKWSILL